MTPVITAVRAYIARGGGADYHDQGEGHWIDGQISTPMSRWERYRSTRSSFGLNVLGTLIVQVEASDGQRTEIGFAPTIAGEPGAWIVERHLARFIEGAPLNSVEDIAAIWDQMYHGTLFYGRKGLVLNAISAVDLALWDLLGRLRGEPVYALLGGAAKDELTCYATGVRPDVAQQLGFIAGKMPLVHGPAEGEQGLADNIATLRTMRDRVGPDFPLMWDTWMSLDLPYAEQLAKAAAEYGLHWLEEPFGPDDYWAYRDLRQRMPAGMLLTTGEHEATRWGFRMLLEMGCADVLQPDVGWCGGLTELLQISEMARAAGVPVTPHGSSVYSYHFAITEHGSDWTEFLMMHPTAEQVVPMFNPMLLDEPIPVDGRIRLTDAPGFGVRLNPDVDLHRPYSR